MQLITYSTIDVGSVVTALQEGKTLVYPTETCYGLGCDATNREAVERIFVIKKRQKDKPLLVVVPDIAMIQHYVEWSDTLQNLADKYWPGPLTVVAPVKTGILLPEGILGPDNSLAFRVTEHPLAAEISRQLDVPLVSTSANIAHLESPYDIEAVLSMFGNVDHKPDIIIDAGTLPHKSPSTIVRVTHDEHVILRQGDLIINV